VTGSEHLARAIARSEVGDLVARMRVTADDLAGLDDVAEAALLVEAADVLWEKAVAGARARQAICTHKGHHLLRGGARAVDVTLWEAVADVADAVIEGDG
jgi:hypothetical protein